MSRTSALRFKAEQTRDDDDSLLDYEVREPPSRVGTEPLAPIIEERDRIAQAIASRFAGRRHAALIPEAEIEALYAERKALLDKYFDSSITKVESRRLEYVRWQLDRIDDARYGEHLDMLEAAVRQYESFRADLASLKDELHAAQMSPEGASERGGRR